MKVAKNLILGLTAASLCALTPATVLAGPFEDGLSAYNVGDYPKAASHYRIAADNGDKNAQYKLARMYREGEGVTRSYEQAAFWYGRASQQGHAEAQYNLAILYEKGQGVTQSSYEAFNLYRRAANSGHLFAQYNLAVLYHFGNGVEKSYSSAVYWFRKTAEAGDLDGQYSLGLAYATGNGVSQSNDQALFWFNKAAAQGHKDGKESVVEMEAILQAQEFEQQELARTTQTGNTRSQIESCKNTEGMLQVVDAYGKTSYKWGKVVRGNRVLSCEELYGR